jgi:hypothetical protein
MKAELIQALKEAKGLDTCVIAVNDDYTLENPYAIDVEDISVFYDSSDDRDRDFETLMEMKDFLPFTFHFSKEVFTVSKYLRSNWGVDDIGDLSIAEYSCIKENAEEYPLDKKIVDVAEKRYIWLNNKSLRGGE